jgi:hypothetical protein
MWRDETWEPKADRGHLLHRRLINQHSDKYSAYIHIYANLIILRESEEEATITALAWLF